MSFLAFLLVFLDISVYFSHNISLVYLPNENHNSAVFGGKLKKFLNEDRKRKLIISSSINTDKQNKNHTTINVFFATDPKKYSRGNLSPVGQK